MLKCNLFLWSKLNFQHHSSSLQCHMILQKSFWYAAQETFLIIINVENNFAASYFCDRDSEMNRNFKEQHLFEIECFAII